MDICRNVPFVTFLPVIFNVYTHTAPASSYHYTKIDTLHMWYLQQKGIECGKVIKDNAATGRVINGKPTSLIYPWIVKIYRARKMMVRGKKVDNPEGTVSSGQLISANVVATCGHCICQPEMTLLEPNIPCLDDKNGKPLNQNNADNKVVVAFGAVGPPEVDLTNWRSWLLAKYDEKLLTRS